MAIYYTQLNCVFNSQFSPVQCTRGFDYKIWLFTQTFYKSARVSLATVSSVVISYIKKDSPQMHAPKIVLLPLRCLQFLPLLLSAAARDRNKIH